MTPRPLVTALLALLLVAAAPPQAPSPAQPQPTSPAPRSWSQADLWDRGSERISFRLAHLSFPVALGTTRLGRILEASREGQGLDNALQYFSPDQQVYVTVYVYAPALPDAGLTAFMTDHAIRLLSGHDLRVLRSGLVAAGGQDGIAIRTDYAGARQEHLASSAAFLRVDRWIVKLRVSGPEARRAEVEAAMDALLQGLRFDGRERPHPIQAVGAAPCPRDAGPPARLLPSDAAETMEDAIMSHVLAGDVAERRAVGTAPHWCTSGSITLPDMTGPTPILRSGMDGPADEDSRRSVLVALVTDSGTLFEVAERRFRNRSRFILIHHQIGRSLVLGSYDAIPSDEQIRAIANGSDRAGGQARARIDYQASGDSNVTLFVAPGEAPPRT